MGRGLSNLMARIHEQEECKGGLLESQRDPLPRGIGLRWEDVAAWLGSTRTIFEAILPFEVCIRGTDKNIWLRGTLQLRTWGVIGNRIGVHEETFMQGNMF